MVYSFYQFFFFWKYCLTIPINCLKFVGYYTVNYYLFYRYEKRALEIYKKMCKLSNEPDFLEAPPLRFRQTENKLVNKTIEKYYNLHKSFPDYYEIFTLLKVLNEKKKLKWTETQLNNICE